MNQSALLSKIQIISPPTPNAPPPEMNVTPPESPPESSRESEVIDDPIKKKPAGLFDDDSQNI